jgi:lysozyme
MILAWLRALFAPRDPIPPPAADVLGAATLPGVVVPPAIPDAAVEMVKRWEGFRHQAYLCPANVWTVGYGTTRLQGGRPVKAGDTTTKAEAEEALRHDLRRFAAAVDRLITVPLAEHERAALISWTYNVGEGALERSTLRRLLNTGDRAGAANEFRRWNQAGGRVLAGLTRRRADEEALFRGQLSSNA